MTTSARRPMTVVRRVGPNSCAARMFRIWQESPEHSVDSWQPQCVKKGDRSLKEHRSFYEFLQFSVTLASWWLYYYFFSSASCWFFLFVLRLLLVVVVVVVVWSNCHELQV